MFLVAVIPPYCILTSEDLELETTDEREHSVFVWVTSLVEVYSFLGSSAFLKISQFYFSLWLKSILWCKCTTFSLYTHVETIKLLSFPTCCKQGSNEHC